MIYNPATFKNVSMLSIFSMEIEEQVVVLNDNLLTIESQIGVVNDDYIKRLETLMRAAHSVKGGARIVGLDSAVAVAHAIEECFVAAKQGDLQLDSQGIDVLLEGVDWFGQLGQVQNEAHADWLLQQEDRTNQLLAMLSALLAEPAAPPILEEATAHTQAATKTLAKTPAHTSTHTSTHKPSHQTASVANRTSERNTSERNTSERNTSGHKIAEGKTPKSSLPKSSPTEHTAVESSAPTNSTVDLPTIPTHSDQPVADNSRARVVKVNAENLNQLMALAGESLVEVNWLQPFTDTMQHLKQRQHVLTGLLAQLQQATALPPTGKTILDKAQKTALDCHALLSDRIGDLDQFSRRFSQLSDNLYREVIASHMRPFSDTTQRFSRMVRDLARAEGKQVKLDIVGDNTQIDRDILERLDSPLTHMLRNAIVHGIEPPERRQQLGKPAIGTIRLEATHRAGMLSITVTDDGCGIEPEQLRQSVIDKQLAPPDLAAQLSEAEIMEFLFLPGFSTAKQVSEVAGRGVGLDIAKSMVQEVGGLLHAFSHPGAGLTFHFQLPLTLSVIRGLVVEISGEPYAFGLTRIEQVRLVKPADVVISENRPYVVIDNENISLVKAQQILELPDNSATDEGDLSVIIIADQTHRYGVVVDRFLGERELVVRPLDERFGKVQDVSAAALTEEGLPLLIVDVADLVRSIEQLVSNGGLSLLSDRPGQQEKKQKRVLVVDDSLTVREMERQLLKNHGYQVDVAVNGMEGWNTVRTGDYDLVVSDIDMPRMNGIELVQQIKGHPKLNQLPVIIVSYKDRQTDKLAGLNAGANYYLTKSSFHDNSLLSAVVDLIGT